MLCCLSFRSTVFIELIMCVGYGRGLGANIESVNLDAIDTRFWSWFHGITAILLSQWFWTFLMLYPFNTVLMLWWSPTMIYFCCYFIAVILLIVSHNVNILCFPNGLRWPLWKHLSTHKTGHDPWGWEPLIYTENLMFFWLTEGFLDLSMHQNHLQGLF